MVAVPLLTKSKIVAVLEEGAAALEILDDAGFKKMAWRNGARALDEFDGDFDNLRAQGKLTTIHGVGAGLAKMIETIGRTGSDPEIEQVKAKLPPGLLEILKVDGVGPKKLQQLWMLHGIASLPQLKTAAEKGLLKTFKGFGAKTADKIYASILFIEQQRGKLLITAAREMAAGLADAIAEVDADLEMQRGGQLARECEVVDAVFLRVVGDDIDGLSEEVLPALNPSGEIDLGETTIRFQQDGTPVTVELVARGDCESGQRVVRTVAEDSAPDHFAELVKRAVAKQLTLTHAGLKDAAGKPVAVKDETDFYARLGLPFIPPPLRENRFEFALADKNAVPPPYRFAQIKGCLHNHTTESDGHGSLEQMVTATRALGLTYFGVADHSQSAAYARGLSPDRLLRQTEDVDGLNRRLQTEGVTFRVFKGTESDILEDGALDFEDWVLQRLDYVVASVHSRFNLGRKEQTQRIVRAIEHPATCILGHMTGRLLLERAPYDVDADAIFRAAAEHQVAIEFNCHPHRLDVDWRQLQAIQALGGKVILSADAHSTRDLEYMKLGADIINKGGLTADDILNTLTADELTAWLKQRRSGR